MGGNMSINRYLNYEETGKRLKEVRERGSMTIEELSLVIDSSSEREIWNYEEGLHAPDLEFIIDFCNYFEVSIDSIVITFL